MKGHTRYDLARDLFDRKALSRYGDIGDLIRTNVGAAQMRQAAVDTLIQFIPALTLYRFCDEYAAIPDMMEWAEAVMARPADFIIGENYLHRWFILPRNALQNVYLHKTLRSDPDVLHDHPWDNTSLVLSGGYVEETPEGTFHRKPGDMVHRKATDAHRLVLIDGQPSVSLFFTGPKVRDWGFHCPGGWVHWETFTGGYHDGRSEKVGGCGELG